MVQLGQDNALDLLNLVPGLKATQLQRNGLQLLVWRPHEDFKKCLVGGSGTGIPCPRCKQKAESAAGYLVVHERQTRYLRQVMGSTRSTLMLGCQYKCEKCSEGEANQQSRAAAAWHNSCFHTDSSGKDG